MKANILLKNKSGIYGIRNTLNNKLYVGKTKCFYKRCHSYLSIIRKENKSKNMNEHLYNSIVKHGLNNFEFFIIEYVDDLNIISDRELFWMNHYNTHNQQKGYNFRKDFDNCMIVHKETSKKISARLKKEWSEGIRDEHGAKLKKSWKNDFERKQQQSELFSKTLTKYSYNLYDSNDVFIKNVKYAELQTFGLQNVIATMYKKQSNKVKFKDYYIEKISNN